MSREEAERSAEERLVFCHRFLPKAVGEDEAELGAAHVWSRTVAGRLHAAGATVLAHAGATVLATFEAAELADAIEVGLDLLDEADEAHLPIGLGVALGVLFTEDGFVYGGALERAQVIASRVPAGEIALDAEARARARGLLLFAKQISPGHQVKAFLVDRTHPRRDASALAMKRLDEPTLPPITRGLLPAIAEVVERAPPHPVLLLRGPPGAGAIEVVEEARRVAGGRARLFSISGTPGAAIPLGSLRSMITSYDLVETAVPAHRAPLALVQEGVLPSREQLADALALTLPEPSWLFLAPLAEIDLATLGVLTALLDRRPDVVLICRYGLDLPVPPELAARERVEMTLPALRTSDTKVVAEAVLGEGVDPEVARRVAVLGGDTPLGVLEAARTLVACGELVRTDDDRFEFRPGAERRQKAAISLDLLIAERAEMLDDESRKTVEAIAILAEPVQVAELEAVLALDALPLRAVSRALGRLDDDGWVERRELGGVPTVRCANVYVRHLLEAALHPARRAELHRFAFVALENRRDGPIGQAELGLHRVLGGHERAGAEQLLEAARASLDAGYARAAARLGRIAARALPELAASAASITASASVEHEGGYDESAEDAVLAAPVPEPRDERSSMELDVEELPSSMPPAPLDVGAAMNLAESTGGLELAHEIGDAIRERDAERIESVARRALLEGMEMAEVARLRALADLLRGDLGGAARGLVRARSLRPAAPVGRRALLTEAMVSLRAGAPTTAIRLALGALAEAREEKDARGESVALFVMSAAYRALGREDDAARLEQRAHV